MVVREQRERVWGTVLCTVVWARRILCSFPLPSTTYSTPHRLAPLPSTTYSTPARPLWGQNGGPFAFLWNYRPLLSSASNLARGLNQGYAHGPHT